ncbi:uncharacterized protein N7503_001577 [Penicillium pulvis]|uniref:uncharacterized protein n=1 Tax=Penicillium pulvis TaxID=1562058 RepID=UPI0025478A00|nr:uncharacterized protein N7503_001577 [Penicillium pulvis]KAJ5809359.1 hypothetical protein N7503_001577 [Penicillium pulvis]
MVDLNGYCPSIFLQESLFPTTGGFIEGRYCEDVSAGNETISCCLPCPLANWRYADNIAQRVQVASWISVAILPLCVFILVSYAVLAPKWTNRHYLSICFTLGICCMEIAFIVPLGSKPNQCYNDITPNDMYSDLSCAFSGSLLLFGGWMVVMWSFIRTIAFHVQVCWEVVLGPKFMWGAFVCGFGIPAIGLAIMLKLTGVSYRFGDICHINIDNGLKDYWIPIMSFAATSLVLQVSTMAYCMHIYLRSLFDKSASTTDNSSGLPSYSSSVRTVSARQAWRRLQRVIQLQWRGVALVMIILGNVIFFAIVFIKLDRDVNPTAANIKKAAPWLLCLAAGGSKEECKSDASGMGPNEATLLAMVYLLSLVGFWNFILFARPLMFAGWLDLFRRGFARRHEFISVDASDRYANKEGFEMLTTTAKTPEPYPTYNMRSPSPAQMAGQSRSPMASPSPTFDRNVHFGQEAQYVPPSTSFSGPRAPGSSHTSRDWDPSSTFAQGRVSR